MRAVVGLLVIIVSCAASCAPFLGGRGSETYPPRLERVLTAAGSNRSALEEVLRHYRAQGDTLKLRAAEYLIVNMEDKGRELFALRDSAGSELDFDCLDYPDYESMIAVLDSMEAQRGPLEFERTETVKDLEVIESGYLIENIDLAFRSWRENPWAKHLGFDDFCDYVLPYRGSGEPLERWRSFFADRYAGLKDRMRDPEDPVEAARLINEEIKGWFTFDPRFYCHPIDQGLGEMFANRLGRCEDMTNLAIYAMRANGLAVTSDYTPYWADTGNNHAWNAILDREGRVIQFMGCEAHPGEYRLQNRMAKVYRKTFADQHGNLAFVKPDWEEVPRGLSGKSMVDVTADYTDVADITIPLVTPAPDSVSFAYLCVFNSGEWRPIDWGKIEDRRVIFTDVGKNIAYLPAYYRLGELLPAATAFILESNAEVRPLIPNKEERGPLRLRSTTRRTERESTDGIEGALFSPGKVYQLFVWEGEWAPAGERVAEGGPLEFDDIPTGGLYWLIESGSRREERIFTYEDGEQRWW